MEVWVYDIEDYENLFMVSFIPLHTSQKLVDAYIKADKAGDEPAKKMLLRAMNAKSFVVFKGYYDDTYVKDDRWLLHDFLSVHKILYGFNSYEYDCTMLDIVQYFSKIFSSKDGCNKDGEHFTTFMNKHSNNIISFKKGYRYTLDFYKNYRRTWTDRDIQKILYLDKSFTGLKSVAISLCWYRLQELPIEPHAIIHSSQIEDIRDYNFNDIFITRALILDQKAELEIRDVGSEEFNIDLTNKSRSSIGKALVTKYYSEITGIAVKDFINLRTNRYVLKSKELVDNKVSFKTSQFNSLFNLIKNSTIHITSDKEKSKWGFSLLYNGTKYIIAKGGLHSKDDPRVFDTRGTNLIMRDADVVSYYPRTILNLKIAPSHLIAYVFLAIVDYVMTKRVEAKHTFMSLEKTDPDKSAMLKKKAEIYKIAINRMYGAFKDSFDYLYDPRCTYMTTINGQLYLLNLVERLELAGIHVISANTDGIVSLFDKSLEPTYKEICTQWQKDFDFELEFTDYERYIRNNVNNYIAIKKGFQDAYDLQCLTNPDTDSVRKTLEKKYVKRKGLFIDTPDFSKGFINPVVSTVLAAHYIYNDDIKESFERELRKPNGIYRFCITQKIDKKFDAQYHTIVDGEKKITKVQQYNRFYISTSSTGNILKYDPEKKKHVSIVAKQNLGILNVYRDEEITDVKISYYINEVYKIMYGTKKKPGISDSKLTFDFPDEVPILIDEASVYTDFDDEDEEFEYENDSYESYDGDDIPF